MKADCSLRLILTKPCCFDKAFCCILAARSGAPNDGTDPFTSWIGNGFYRSKQNSDAAGFHYQWGRKDSFTFATSSIKWGASSSDYGKYPVKIYNGKSELIYQDDIGDDNTNMAPEGGVIAQNRLANSMMETVKKPNVFYYPGGYNAVISLAGHSKELWNYYWTSYSRGTDGRYDPTTATTYWHNTYLDGYIVLRSKSIYDPCPYGYRTPTNGTYNDIKFTKWIQYSYDGGAWNQSWLPAIGSKNSLFTSVGERFMHAFSSISNSQTNYCVYNIYFSREAWSQSYGISIRCIEDATGKTDHSEIPKTYYTK